MTTRGVDEAGFRTIAGLVVEAARCAQQLQDRAPTAKLSDFERELETALAAGDARLAQLSADVAAFASHFDPPPDGLHA
jgi:glycine/serine hydroxymethyltransferase